MLIASLLFYWKLSKDLEAIGFKLNIFDYCVSNNMIWYKKITITWRVDEIKVSHAEKDIVDALIQQTKEKYAYITKLKPSREKINNYPSMNLDYTTLGKVKFFMKEYIDKIIEIFYLHGRSVEHENCEDPISRIFVHGKS